MLALTKKAADWQLAHPSKHAATDWTQAAFYTGVMALYYASGDKKYMDAMVSMGEANQWKAGKRPYHADDYAVCQTYCELYLLAKKPKMIEPTRAQFDFVLAHPKDQTLEYHKTGGEDRWSWCDSLFMAPPAWARLYAVTGDTKYLNFMDKEYWNTTSYLYDPTECLFFRDNSFFSKKAANGKKVFWSRGNGWVYAGITRVLDYLPAGNVWQGSGSPGTPGRAKYEKLFTDMTGAIVKCQQEDGLWHPSLLDPAEVPVSETSGSAFFCYGLAWGVNHRLLDESRYWPLVLRSWNGLTSKVLPDGMVGSVQKIGSAPDKLDADSTEVYGTGAFLLAGSEIYKHLKVAVSQH